MDLQLLINGIALGSIIAPAAVGLTLTYGILRLSNFAHGDFMTLGAYLAWMLNTESWKPVLIGILKFMNIPITLDMAARLASSGNMSINIWLSIIIGMILTILAMLLSDIALWTPMRKKRASTTTIMIASIGLGLFIRNGITLFFGASPQKYDLPLDLPLKFAGVNIKYSTIATLTFSLLAMVALHYILQKTKIGKAMRAVADDPDLAKVTGINVQQVVLWTWVITGALTALAGSLYGLDSVRINMGWNLTLPMFAAVVLGGIGNPYGAIAGAFVIGIVQDLFFPIVGTDFKLAVALVIMVLTLLIRPQGLFKGMT
jgi:neutral amino acid transport system permease protein